MRILTPYAEGNNKPQKKSETVWYGV